MQAGGQTAEVLFGSALAGCRPLQGLRPRTPGWVDCGGSVCKRAGSLRGFSLGWLLRAVALDRGFAPVPPLVQSAEILFASGQAVCVGSVWFGSDGLSPLTGASPPYPRFSSLRRFCLQAGRDSCAVCGGSVYKRDFCQAFLKKASIKARQRSAATI